jgi:hypothetical protein
LFEQSTRKYKWESYGGKAESLDTIRAKQVMGQKIGCGSQLVDSFVKLHKEKMCKLARERGLLHPMGVRLKKWQMAMQKKAKEERAMEEARVQMHVLNDHIVALCASE